MRKTIAKIFLLTITSFLVFGMLTSASKKKSARANEVVVYTYNSFSGEWGAGPEIARLFEEKTGITIDEDAMAEIKTVADIVNYLEAHK